MAELLLDGGSDPNAANIINVTTLQSAVKSGNTDMVQLLIDRGADPNRGNAYGSPLQTAAKRRYTSIVKLLINRGAKPNEATEAALQKMIDDGTD